MSLNAVIEISADRLLAEVASRLPLGHRLVTMTCTDTGEDFDLLYHFDKDYQLSHLRLRVPRGQAVPSVSGIYFSAAIVENEIKDLFGIVFEGLAVDYGGRFMLGEDAPVAPQRRAPPPAAAPEGSA